MLFLTWDFVGLKKSVPTLLAGAIRSGVCCTGPYLRRNTSRLAPVAPYVAGDISTVPVSLTGVPSGDAFAVEVPTSRLRTEIRGSMNFVLYSERT